MSVDHGTIFALASGVGRTAVSVIRVSGDACAGIAASMLEGGLPPVRRAVVRRILSGAGDVLDRALVLWMPGPASFTGEDTLELHVHGGSAVRAAVLCALSALGCHPAEPGEFTRRAFRNGRLDLTAVEGLADLIDAETEVQRRQAIRQAEGGLAQHLAQWRESLLEAAAALEASLDFADEGDVDDAALHGPALARMAAVEHEIAAVLDAANRGERLRDGYTVVIAGPPNAGKSTLLNAIARRDVALVSPLPGTTRDAIEIRCDLGGLPVVFVDTAGLRETCDLVEQAGIARARARMTEADLTLWLVPPGGDLPSIGADDALAVSTMADLEVRETAASAPIRISALTGDGMDVLLSAIEDRASATLGRGDALVTRERQRVALTGAVAALARGRAAAAPELVAEDLRLALRSLEHLLGRVDIEDVLGRIFSTFCIGK